MKTTKQMLVVIFMFATGLSPLFAQSPDRSYQEKYDGPFVTEVFCDGVQVDLVVGTLKTHEVFHYNKSGFSWAKISGNGTALGEWSGEIFTYKEIGGFKAGEETYTWRYHLKGNQGSHYIGTITWNYITDEIFPGKTKCL